MKQQRFVFVFFYLIPMLLISTGIRSIIFAKEFFSSQLPFVSYPYILLNGFVSDLVTAAYFLIPITFLVFLVPKKFNSHHPYRWVLRASIVVSILFWVWCSISEWYFWDEFSSRFNFIAVDYLIYTKEVIGNIRESFSVTNIVLTLGLTSFILSFISLWTFNRYLDDMKAVTAPRLPVLGLLALPLFAFWVESLPIFPQENFNLNELSKNGVHEFFSAFRNNELDFKVLYKNIPHNEMVAMMAEELKEKNYKVTHLSDDRLIKIPAESGVDRKPNLIFITVESLGAKFIGSLGAKDGLTPYLDKLTERSIFFTNIYATGTRTVRGLEALSLSLPPTPGASIVRRKKNHDLFTIGSILSQNKYETKFIYGGHGLFDNMNEFFRNNQYKIVDRTDFSDDEVTFSNTWGVADEDLFNKVISEANSSFKKKVPFFSMVLTTSNHRPFTYPDGKIDIPSHTSRAGAVKYTDYAIGKFFEKAEKQPWFKNTVFVVVADHSTEGRGVIDIPVDSYHIPLWIYSPDKTAAKRVDTVASQIDVLPTVLSVMGIRTPEQFLGKNILNMTKEEERFFVGTYQKVGYYQDGVFVSLGPKKTVETYFYDPIVKKLGQKTSSPEIEKIAISYYQYASYLFKNGLYKSTLPTN